MPREGLVTLTHVIYGLHAFSALTGMLSPAMIVTAFLTGWPSIIAVILNYVKRSDVRGTWLDSHFSWQIRTFWFALLWLTLGAVLFVTVVGIPFSIVLWFGTGIWVLYRIIRGWLALSSPKKLPERSVPDYLHRYSTLTSQFAGIVARCSSFAAQLLREVLGRSKHKHPAEATQPLLHVLSLYDPDDLVQHSDNHVGVPYGANLHNTEWGSRHRMRKIGAELGSASTGPADA